MRTQQLKLRRGNSTKSERIFLEILKELHIPFRTKVIIEGREIDFLVKNYAIEINGHPQYIDKNELLINNGYIPIHISNEDLFNNKNSIKEKIKKYVNSPNNTNISCN